MIKRIVETEVIDIANIYISQFHRIKYLTFIDLLI